MGRRSETAAATRQSLLDAAGTLLDTGGPEAVTLREVGALTGVSRSAPYRHFADKESLLAVLATKAWSRVGDELETLAASEVAPEQSLRAALLSLISIGRSRPHLYRLMFIVPTGDPTVTVRAAERAQDLFLGIVSRVVGPQRARIYGALLLTTAHGIAGLELSGHLTQQKWHTDAEELIDTVVALLPNATDRR